MDKDEALEYLKNFKKESGWSYDRIARETGLHTQTIIGWFQGKHKPSDLAIRVIKEFLGSKHGK